MKPCAIAYSDAATLILGFPEQGFCVCDCFIKVCHWISVRTIDISRDAKMREVTNVLTLLKNKNKKNIQTLFELYFIYM